MTIDDALSDDHIRAIYPGIVRALTGFLQACASDDERTVAALMVADHFDASMPGTRVDACLAILGLTATECAEAVHLFDPGPDPDPTMAVHDDGRGAEFTLAIAGKRAQLAVRDEGGRWRVQIFRPPGLFDRLTRRSRGRKRVVGGIHIERDDWAKTIDVVGDY